MAGEAPLEFEWHPARLLQEYDFPQDFALLVLNQPLRNGANLRKLWKNAAVRVAADGGANRLHKLSSFHGKFSNLQAIIGDLDSLSPTVRDFYSCQPSPVTIVHEADQESTDFEKAVHWIRREQPEGTDIVALGGIGGRVDQGMRQLHNLYLAQTDPRYAEGRVYLVSSASLTFVLKTGRHRIHVRGEGTAEAASGMGVGGDAGDDAGGPFGKHVGIIPLREPSRISTKGLQWDVTDWATEMGGPRLSTSNHVLPDTQVVEIETDKDVLFTIALGQVEGEDGE